MKNRLRLADAIIPDRNIADAGRGAGSRTHPWPECRCRWTQSAGVSSCPRPHAGSGTGWQPASVPANEWMWMRGGWELMAHGVIFADYNQQGGPRGAGKAESVNWGMLMEQHRLGAGTILFRADVFRRVADFAASRISRNFFRRARPITASRWSITSIRTMCLRNCRRSTRCR